MSVTIRVRPKLLGVAVMWAASLALVALAFVLGRAEVGQGGIVVGMGAMTWTLILAMKHCRRVILEVMSYEHRMQLLDDDDEGESCTVRALRR